MSKLLIRVLGVAGIIISAGGCGALDAEHEALETATKASGLACVAWTPVQSGTATIEANGLAAVHDGNFTDPFGVNDGYAFKLTHNSTCHDEELRIFAHTQQGGPEFELAPLR